MGKVKIKRKSTLIDMTAMSDVTVLLLTFFMLTSTFLQKEPTVVFTPSSVSEEPVPLKDLVTILVSPADKGGRLEDPTVTEGKIFIAFAGDSTKQSADFRRDVLLKAVKFYNEQHQKSPININDAQASAFADTYMMGTPFKYLPEVLNMDVAKRDKLMSDLANPETAKMIGIPITANYKDKEKLNDFQIWMKAVKSVAQDYKDELTTNNPELTKEDILKKDLIWNTLTLGQGVIIKADKDAPFSVINVIFENLRFMDINKFQLMTSHKAGN